MVDKEYIELSIIVPTIGRKQELDDLLNSINCSEINVSFEILIIDQNQIGYIDDILPKYLTLNIKHYHVNFKGLSKAKNFGVSEARGKYVAFPDDDCKVVSNTFTIGLALIKELELDIVFGRCIDEKGNNSVLTFKSNPYYLNTDNMVGGFVEATAIAKRIIFDKYGFDENMGAGCFFGAEEGFDWLYRVLKSNRFKVYFHPDIIYYHPQVILQKGDINSLLRVFKYRCGTAYLCKKHHFYLKYLKRLFLVITAAICYLVISRKKSKYYLVEFCALLIGWSLSEKKYDKQV